MKDAIDQLLSKIGPNKLGSRIRSLRESAGISQNQMGKMTGMTRDYYRFREKGCCLFTSEEVSRIVESLNCKLSDIL